MRDERGKVRSEPWRLETIEVDALNLLDADLATAAFIALQIAHGRVDAPRRVAAFFGDVARELAELAAFRDAYLESLGVALADVDGDGDG